MTGTRALAVLAIAMTLAACQGSSAATAPNSLTPQSITLQLGGAPGVQRCDASGDVTAVLSNERAQRSPAYDINATEWEQWKRQGAVQAYFAVYGRTAADCAAASDSSTGAPRGGVMIGLVVQFQDTMGAARNFQSDSTLMGLGPKNIRFVELAGGATIFGPDTGLGTDSVVGRAVVGGAQYFVAMWQSSRFESDFMGYDMAFADADSAVKGMNRRIHGG
jgi:hypothetical protein